MFNPSRAERPSSGATIGPEAVLGGRYLLRERLDHGRFGVVHRALDLRGQRVGGRAPEVALLVLPAELSDNAALLDNVRRDCARLAALRHPHVVQVLDFDGDARAHFIVLELVDGETLRDVLDHLDEPLRRADALAVIVAVGAALEHAHSQGLVHGDVRAENVLVAGAHDVKLLFAGTSLLRTAPFAAETRDDVYGLGCLAYELLTGRLPPGGYHGAGPDSGARLERPRGLTRRQWAALAASLEPRERRPRSVAPLVAAFGGARRRTPASGLPSDRWAVAEPARRIERSARAQPRSGWIAWMLLAALVTGAGYLYRDRAGDWIAAAPAALARTLRPLAEQLESSAAAALDALRPPPLAEPPAERAIERGDSAPAAPPAGSGAESAPARPGDESTSMPSVDEPASAAAEAPAAAAAADRPEVDPSGDRGAAASAAGTAERGAQEPAASEPSRPTSGREPEPAEAEQPASAASSARPPRRDPAPTREPAPGARPRGGDVGTAGFTVREVVVSEGDRAVALEIRRDAADGPLTVAWWTSDGSAVAGEDYAMFGARIETFEPGETSRTIYVPITNDTVREGSESFDVHLRDGPEAGGVRGTVTTVTVTVRDDD